MILTKEILSSDQPTSGLETRSSPRGPILFEAFGRSNRAVLFGFNVACWH